MLTNKQVAALSPERAAREKTTMVTVACGGATGKPTTKRMTLHELRKRAEAAEVRS